VKGFALHVDIITLDLTVWISRKDLILTLGNSDFGKVRTPWRE